MRWIRYWSPAKAGATVLIMALMLSIVTLAPNLVSAIDTPPTVSIVPRTDVTGNVPAGQEFRVDVEVSGLSGADAAALQSVTVEMNYPTALLEFVGVRPGSLLTNPAPGQPFVSPQVSQPSSADPAKGWISVGVSRAGTEGVFRSEGAGFTVVFRAKSRVSGSATINIQQHPDQVTSSATGVDLVKLDTDGTPVLVHSSPSVQSGAVNVQTGIVQGQMKRQARTDHSGIAVTLVQGDTAIATTTTNSGGNYSIADLDAGRYKLLVTSDTPFLKAVFEDVKVSPGATVTLSATTLWGGDIDGDGVVYTGDLAAMGGAWRSTSDGVGSYVAEADLNGDGKVYGPDLAIMARNWKLKPTLANARMIDDFTHNLNLRVLQATGVTALNPDDRLAVAQLAEGALSSSGARRDVAKFDILEEVLTALRFDPLRDVLLNYHLGLDVVLGRAEVKDAVAKARTVLDTGFSYLDPVDFRDVDNELAALEAESETTVDAVGLVMVALELQNHLQSRVGQDDFLAGYVAQHAGTVGDTVCGYGGASAGCDLNDGATWGGAATQLADDLSSRQWWTTLENGIWQIVRRAGNEP